MENYKKVSTAKIGKEYAVQRFSDGAFIPFDPANTDYQQYLAWLDGYEMVNGKLEKTSDSNTPQPADE
jgi:hypothetical protein